MNRLKSFMQSLIVIIVIVIIAGLLAYVTGLLGLGSSSIRPLGALPTPKPMTIPGTPVVRFARLDDAFLGTVDDISSPYSQSQLQVDRLGLPQIGAYLPRTGNTIFEYALPTPTATPLPFPTSPPLPLPAIAGDPLATIIAPDGIARTLPYGGDACAPAGMPADGILTQRFHAYHGGIDIGVPLNTPVIATHSGIVTYAGWSDVGYGYLVIVQNSEFITYYAHNTSFNVTVSQLVGKGSILAWSGSTGNSTGPHIHYETRVNDIPVDPLSFEARGYPSC